MATSTQTLSMSALADEFRDTVQRARNLDLKPLIKGEVLDAVREGIAENFDQARSPDGTAWPPRKHLYPHPILVKSTAMKRSVTEEGGEGYALVDETSLTVGSDVEYAAFHEFGTSKLPERSFMGVSEERLKDLDDVVADGILDLLLGPS